MSRVFITGSTDGLGLMAGRLLAADGHSVTLHARSQARAADARAALPEADGVVIGDLSSIAGMREVADQCNTAGRFHAVIHNAGVGYRERRRIQTEDGLAQVFAINVLADDISLGPVTQAWLAVGESYHGVPAEGLSDQPAATVTGAYFFHQEQVTVHPAARDIKIQDQLVGYCADLTGATLVIDW